MYARYNYLGVPSSTNASILSDIVTLLCGKTTMSELTGKIILSNAAVGITAASVTVTWTGADDGTVVAGRKTLSVGQTVIGVGIPANTTIATITNQVGFTLSAAATVTNAAARLSLGSTVDLPSYGIGYTSLANTITSASTSLTLTNRCAAGSLISTGMTVNGIGIPASTTVSSITNANALVMSATATATTTSTATVVIAPAKQQVDLVNTQFFNSYTAAGWELLYYNMGSLFAVILRAPLIDVSTSYKYLYIDASSILTGLTFSTAESYSNVGTATNTTTVVSQPINPVTAGSMFISASARHALFMGSTGVSVGNVPYGKCGVFERTRLSPWDTTAAGYPPVCFWYDSIISSASVSSIPRLKNNLGIDITTVTGITIPSTNKIQVKVPDAFGGYNTPFNDLIIQYPGGGFYGGSLSAYSDVWSGLIYPLNLDEVVRAGTRYVFLVPSANATFGLMVPKG